MRGVVRVGARDAREQVLRGFAGEQVAILSVARPKFVSNASRDGSMVTSMAARAALAESVPGVCAVAPVIFREFFRAVPASFARAASTV